MVECLFKRRAVKQLLLETGDAFWEFNTPKHLMHPSSLAWLTMQRGPRIRWKYPINLMDADPGIRCNPLFTRLMVMECSVNLTGEGKEADTVPEASNQFK